MSVGIPTYDRPDGLRRTLECIVNQTYRNLEIIVSDNCSTTVETPEVVAGYRAADPRIIYHRQPRNIGLDANFKFVLSRARGEFFFWAADDDEWTPDFVEVCLGGVGRAGSAMTGMRMAVRPRGLLRWKPDCELSPERSPFENALTFFRLPQPSLFYGLHRTDTIRCFLDERMYDHYDCFFILRQILTHGFRVVPRPCYHVGVESETPIFKPDRRSIESCMRDVEVGSPEAWEGVLDACRRALADAPEHLAWFEHAWGSRSYAARAARRGSHHWKRYGGRYLNLDASEFGVKDVFGVAELCEKLLGYREEGIDFRLEGRAEIPRDSLSELQEKEAVIRELEVAAAERLGMIAEQAKRIENLSRRLQRREGTGRRRIGELLRRLGRRAWGGSA